MAQMQIARHIRRWQNEAVRWEVWLGGYRRHYILAGLNVARFVTTRQFVGC